ncbi:MAG: thioredoxin family protein [Rectinema subterraneum]|uniref:thioredoxin family protein n=1 Tax=Rectinema subterraneum TaxID=2653714 RepID=UPI003C79C9CE
MKTVQSYNEITQLIQQNEAVLFYCSAPSCGVCKSLKPKVIELVQSHFPNLPLYYVDIDAIPETRGQLSVYSVPAVLVYFKGKELIREARNFGIMELGAKIDRYYSMIFESAV